MIDAEVVLGVSGGVAAFKSAALASQLVQAGAKVSVVMTEVATRFVGTATFAALTGRPVCTQVFDEAQFPLGAHISLAENADLLCIAPATANYLGKTANGIADDLLSTLYLSFSGPVLMAPAMNNHMWEKKSVARNVARLRDDGVQIIEPAEGWLSCRSSGKGRMAEPEAILKAIGDALAAR
jgi:phosphopantothenoylcysteine decarboxylase